MPEFDLIPTLTQFGFTGVAIFLLIYVLRESSKREDRMVGLLGKYSEQLANISNTLARLSDDFQHHDQWMLENYVAQNMKAGRSR